MSTYPTTNGLSVIDAGPDFISFTLPGCTATEHLAEEGSQPIAGRYGPAGGTSGHWLMSVGTALWHFVVDGVALCGARDDGASLGSVSAPDCPVCSDLFNRRTASNALVLIPASAASRTQWTLAPIAGKGALCRSRRSDQGPGHGRPSISVEGLLQFVESLQRPGRQCVELGPVGVHRLHAFDVCGTCGCDDRVTGPRA